MTSEENNGSATDANRAEQPAPPAEPRTYSFFVVACTAVVYITVSVGLICFNKVLMSKDRFPQPLALVTLHMGTGFIGTVILRLIRPSFFPTWHVLTDSPGSTILRMFPISVCCAVSFVLSNAAFIYVSVALLQMLKEFNVVAGYFVSLAVGLAVWNWRLALVLVMVAGFTCGAVQGDVSFVWIGVIMQLIGQVFQIGQLILMNYYLSADAGANASKKLDQFTLLFVITPFAFLLLGVTQAFRWESVIWTQFTNQWPLLVGNCVMAFGLNIIVTTFLQMSSAVTMMLLGILKDIFLIFGSAIFFNDALATVTIICFLISMVLILFHGVMKMYLKDFDNGFIAGIKAVWVDVRRFVASKIYGSPDTSVTKDPSEVARLLSGSPKVDVSARPEPSISDAI